VTLDGTGSSDPDGDALTYAWTQTAGPTVTLSDAAAAQPTFTTPTVAADTVLTFALAVTDAHGAGSDVDTVQVTVVHGNQAPQADAGADQTVDRGAAVTLDGTGSSDPEGAALTYSWSQTAGPSVSLDDLHAAQPTFTAPTVTTTTVLTFDLVVADGLSTSAPDAVRVTVRGQPGVTPTVDAGPDQVVDAGAVVTLAGSGTDPEGGAVTYAWAQVGTPSVTLAAAATPAPSFTAPRGLTVAEVLTFELTVTTTSGATAADTVQVTVLPDTATPATLCGCNAGTGPGGSAGLALLAVAGLLVRRRRR
jgi:MYXO-CTERM domain-containing protein